jgi:hypothetical protein
VEQVELVLFHYSIYNHRKTRCPKDEIGRFKASWSDLVLEISTPKLSLKHLEQFGLALHLFGLKQQLSRILFVRLQTLVQIHLLLGQKPLLKLMTIQNVLESLKFTFYQY